ncbi:MAG: zf-HC2 domain-containing protein [Calditrichaeota bacterium]|nr:MAG: zf-HC2 domain-containing protein [Calditrichota bacterium]
MKPCKFYQKIFPSAIYDELDDVESGELKAHLQICTSCREEYSRLQSFLGEIPARPIIEPEEESLQLLRNLVSSKIKQKKTQTATGPGAFFTFLMPRPVFQFGFAAVLLILGFFIGKSSRVEQGLANGASFQMLIAAQDNFRTENVSVQPFILGINKIEFDPGTGKIVVNYNTINDVQMRASVDDQNIHSLLQQAVLENEDYSVRLQALKTARAIAHETPAAFDETYLQIFRQLLSSESDLGLRLQVLKILQALPWNDSLKSILRQVLQQNSEDALRIAAFRTITEREQTPDELNEVLVTAKYDTSEFIKHRAEKLLNELKDKETTLLRREE